MTATGRLASTLGIALGIGLVVLGIGAYVLSDFASVTALIPTLFGVLIALLGAVARSPARRRVAVYGIGLLALLGVLGSIRGVADLLSLLAGEPIDSPVAALAQGAMIATCLVLLVAAGRYALEER